MRQGRRPLKLDDLTGKESRIIDAVAEMVLNPSRRARAGAA